MIKGNDWVGNYSRFTYDESKNYVMLLKEKGVPVLDDEFNAPQEILLTIIRRLTNDITGSGFLTKDSFKISPIARENDFSIGAGVAVVDGWRVAIETSVDYSTQPVTQPSLTTPSSNRTDIVYLDIWHEEIDGVEDPNIIDPQLGLRTSCRLKLVWAVKVAEGTTMPPNGFDSANKYHWRFKIAELNRVANNPYITSEMIVDKRSVLKVSKLLEPYYATGQNNYSVTLNDVTTLSSGDVIAVTFQNSNSDDCTLSYNSSDNYPIKSSDGYNLPSGFLRTNVVYFLYFTGSEFVVSGANILVYDSDKLDGQHGSFYMGLSFLFGGE